MKFKRPKRLPVLLALAVLALVGSLRVWNPDFPDRLERMTCDWRARIAQKFPAPVATNLAFVAMEESSIATVQSGRLGYRYGLYWPRQVYGRLVEELSAQGARAVAFDVLFGELRPDHPQVQMADGGLMESDDFFAQQMRLAGKVLVAATPDVFPPPLFATNAHAIGDITTEKDSDGVLRRVRAFRDVRRWHPLFQQLAAHPELGVDLDRAKRVAGKIRLPQTGTTNVLEISVDAENNFSPADFVGEKKSAAWPPRAQAYVDERLWHLGVVLAAQELQLDLARAAIDLPHGRIVLRGANGVERIVPVDRGGYFYVDWRLTPNDPRLLRAPLENLLAQDRQRLLGQTSALRDDFRGRLVVVGSAAQGNDLTDRGATPLENDTLLVSKHWNVASSIITGQFIHRAPLSLELALIVFLGALSALLTWQSRSFAAAGGLILLAAVYAAMTTVAFVKFRFWLPLVYPVAGAMLLEYVLLAAYRVMFEEEEKRRVKAIFSRLVSPDVVNELLDARQLSLGGTRREVTLLFADIRGFTAMTDEVQEQISEYARTHQLAPAVADKCYEESAQETLETVNSYLAAVADAVKNHGGTLDKYIGDCVMAFWNAPAPNEKHASAGLTAAIEAQRAIQKLNEERLARNPAREIDNRARLAAGQPPRPLHLALHLGTGINTGIVTVGLMGSERHILNYTVFGRAVNLASRLEGVSGSGRIIISDTTYNQLLRHAPPLAATCTELFPVTVKGIRNAVRIYEVPWK